MSMNLQTMVIEDEDSRNTITSTRKLEEKNGINKPTISPLSHSKSTFVPLLKYPQRLFETLEPAIQPR